MPTMKKRMKAAYLAREEKEKKEAAIPTKQENTETKKQEKAEKEKDKKEKEETPIPKKQESTEAKKPDKTEKEKEKKDSSPTKAKKRWLKEEDILVSKRARHVPGTEMQLNDWLNNNFEKHAVEEGFQNLLTHPVMYDLYTDVCQKNSSILPEFTVFRRSVVKLYGKDIGLKADSEYKGQVKERKEKRPVKESAVQAAALRTKMKDLMYEGLKEAGNPRKGLTFRQIKNYIIGKFPAARLDINPKPLLGIIKMQAYFRHIIVVRGVGMCGYYRMPGPPDKEEEEDEKKPKKEEKKPEKNDKGGKKEKEAAKKEKKEGDDEDKDEDKEEDSDKKPKRDPVKKSPGKTTVQLLEQTDRLLEPVRVEDTFPMALTFMAEPKEASFKRIKSYVTRYFHGTNEKKLKTAMTVGEDKGLWEQTTGSVATGTYRLLINDLNPSHVKSLEDRICLAILATTEPKQASIKYIREYIQEYYPKFKIIDRPSLIRQAIDRCINGGLIRQISGIGLSGTFQLGKSFSPSPALLAGEEEASSDESEEAESEEEEAEESGDDSDESAASYGSGQGEKYRLKPTRSGRDSGVIRSSITKFGKGKSPTKKRATKASQGRRR